MLKKLVYLFDFSVIISFVYNNKNKKVKRTFFCNYMLYYYSYNLGYFNTCN